MENCGDYSKLFYYDESSPTFLRHSKDKWAGFHKKILKAKGGGIAGWITPSSGYAQVSVNSQNTSVHRVVLALHGIIVPKNCEVDHIDGNPSNNAINNLRVVSRPINTRNRRKLSNNTSGTAGVSWWVDRHGTTYAVAHGVQNGEQVRKVFSVKKLGIMQAFKGAVIWRHRLIEELNSVNAGYTDRHGA